METSWTDALHRTHLKQLQQPLPRQVRRFSSASIDVSNARQVWTSRETQPAAPALHLKRDANSAMRQVSLRIGKESTAAMSVSLSSNTHQSDPRVDSCLYESDDTDFSNTDFLSQQGYGK